MPLTPAQRSELIQAFLYCMRDHNLGFNPAWEYLRTSEMQKLWYEFEYLHGRFLKKAAVEVGSRAFHIAALSGFGAAAAAVTGPVGMAATAVSITVGAGTAMIGGGTVSSLIEKGKRQWGLHKGRQALQTTAANEYDDLLWRTISIDGYYYWPGYSKSGLSIDEWSNFNFETPFGKLKTFLFFKPPKSGERLNQYEFLYPTSILLIEGSIPNNPKELQRFSLIWEASSFWPVLDYLYFNQSFATMFQQWKKNLVLLPAFPSRQNLFDFLFASRFYFLSRDFYLDHFFERILPKYEILISRFGGVLVGSNILDRALNIFNQSISSQPDALFQRSAAQKISRKILNACYPFIKDLSPDIAVGFQQALREFFFFSASTTQERPMTEMSQNLQKALFENEKNYEAIIENEALNSSYKKAELRKLLLLRKAILSGGFAGAPPLFQPIDLQAIIQDSGAQILGTAKRRFGFDLIKKDYLGTLIYEQISNPKSDSAQSAQQIYTDAAAIDALTSGLEISADLIAELHSALMQSPVVQNQLARLPARYRAHLQKTDEIFNVMKNFYRGVKFSYGTAKFIYSAVSGKSLLDTMLGSGVPANVSSLFLGGPNVVYFVIGLAVQLGKNVFYHKLDQECLLLVDQLIGSVPNTTQFSASSSSTAPASAAASTPSSSSSAATGAGAAEHTNVRAYFDLLQSDAHSDIANAEIYGNSTHQMRASSLKLPGVFSTTYPDTGEMSVVYELNLPDSKPLSQRFFGFCVECEKAKISEDFGSCRLSGTHLVTYAQTMTGMYSVLLDEWVTSLYTFSDQILENKHTILSKYDSFWQSRIEILNKIYQKNPKKTHVRYTLYHPKVPQMRESLPAPEGLEILASTWSTTTQIAFYLLKLENSIGTYRKEKNHIKRFALAQNILNEMETFIKYVTDDKDSFAQRLIALQMNPDLGIWRFPNYLRSQIIYVRLLFLEGMNLFTEWFDEAIKNLKITSSQSRSIAAGALEGLKQSESILTGRVDSIQPKNIEFKIRAKQYENLQRSQFSYDGPSFSQWPHMLQMIASNFGQIHSTLHPELQTPAGRGDYRDFSELGLGLRFTKDPSTFTETEKTVLYDHFGRVVRHLFNAAPTPSSLFEMQDKVEKHLTQASSTGVNDKWIEEFFKDYFEYLSSICKVNNFIYYAKVYQFIKESNRFQFLEDTNAYRHSLQDIDQGVVDKLHSHLLHPIRQGESAEMVDAQESLTLLLQELSEEEQNFQNLIREFRRADHPIPGVTPRMEHFCSRCHRTTPTVFVNLDGSHPMYQCGICGKQKLIGG